MAKEEGTTVSDNIPDSEGGKYHVAEVLKFLLQPNKKYDLKIEFLDNHSSTNASSASMIWAIDSMLIDEELLYLEDEEADRVYQELKTRSFRRRNMEEKENKLTISMSQQEESDEEDPTN